MLFAGYFSEHHIPFSNVEHLLGICQRAFSDSDVAKKVSCNRTKLLYTIQDGIAHYEKLELPEICRAQKFSVVIDESTDASITQVLAIIIRYFDFKKLDVTDALPDTVVVENSSVLSFLIHLNLSLRKETFQLQILKTFKLSLFYPIFLYLITSHMSVCYV